MNPEKWEFSKCKNHVKERFGLTPADYMVVFKLQNGFCAICHNPPIGKRFHIDHCHSDGSFRGLLCVSCNMALERMESIPDWDKQARLYLSKRSYVYGCRPRKDTKGMPTTRFTELSYANAIDKIGNGMVN